MKNVLFLSLLLAMLFLGAMSAEAADRYVRAGASGSSNGNDWANAYTTLPANLTRGDTYFIADGSYPGRTFNTAASGTARITIKKATIADHGTSTGWNDTYGDGQAIFTGAIVFRTANWLFDGVTGGGPTDWTCAAPCGFRLTFTGDAMLFFDNGISDVTARHIQFQGVGSYNGSQTGVHMNSCTNCTLSYFYMYDIGLIPFFSGGINVTYELGYVRNFFEGTSHSETCSCWNFGSSAIGTHTFRYMLVSAAGSTGGFMWDNSSNHSAEFRFYGNIFYWQPSLNQNNCCNGLIAGWSGGNGEDYFNARVYNNSFVNIPGAQVASTFPQRSGSNEARNNLFYTINNPGGGSDVWQTVTHNHFISTSPIGTNTSTSVGNPFVDVTKLNFALTAATPAGVTLSAPYDRDMFGKQRGANGVWNRGAIELGTAGGADLTPPAAPINVQIQ